MATAKKTPVAKPAPAAKKAAVKVAPAKKSPVIKSTGVKTPVAKPAPVKFKVGQEVVGTSGHGQKTKGRFVSMEDTDRGLWVNINVAPKGKPAEIKRYRPKAVSAA